MRLFSAIIALCLIGSMSLADMVVPSRTIRAGDLLGPDDVMVKPGDMAGVLTRLDEVVGAEARVALYAGRPIRPADVGPPALVERNAYVRLIFNNRGLEIVVEGRALGRGAEGDLIRVMNLGSRSTLMGIIRPDGAIDVGR